MSLLDALNIATSSLRTTQASISVISENVANSQNANYADRSPIVTELPANGGVELAGVQRATDQALRQQTLQQSSQSSGDAALSSLYGQLDDATGASSGTPPLASAMAQLQTAWQSFEATPEDVAAQQSVIQAGTGVTQAIGNASQAVDQLATTAAGDVGTDVTTLNTDLAQIAQLNQQIVAATATNTPAPDLEDQRDAAVASVAKLVSINTVARPDGSLSVFTPNGLSLVDKAAISFAWDGTNITASGSTTSLNSSFQNGSIGATLGFLRTDGAAVQSTDPRLGALQKLRDQLNGFASSLYDRTATPPPAFEAAYDNATTQTGEQATAFFTTSDGSATATSSNLVVNPAILNGTAQIKQAAATPVVAALTETDQSLNAGALAVTGVSYSQLANAILANTSSNAGTISSAAKTSTATTTALTSRLASETGVNVDNEMSNLIVLQNSYAAAARVATTIDSMLTSLMAIGQ